MVMQLCKESDQEQLLNLYKQESDFMEVGCTHFAQSFRKKVSLLSLLRGQLYRPGICESGSGTPGWGSGMSFMEVGVACQVVKYKDVIVSVR